MATAVVTGVPGWLGNRLLHFLRAPHPDWPDDVERPSFDAVRCLVHPDAPVERVAQLAPDAEVVRGDVRDPVAVGRLLAGAHDPVVFHLAGIIHPRRVRELDEVNHQGTRNVLAAAAAAGARRVVATSSNSPAGVSRDPSERFDEETPDRPYMGYGRSKQRMERALAEAHAAGLETVTLRPCWFYGPEQPERQTRFFRMIRTGKAPIVGSGEARRSMSYVDNTSLGLLLAADRPHAAGRLYWIADERPYSMNEIIDTVEEVLRDDFGLGVDGGRRRLPGVASEMALALDAAIQTTGRYQQELHVLSEMNKTIACSIDRARDELGYRPGVHLREGMRRSVAWCLEQGHEL